MSAIQYGFGVAKTNELAEIMRLSEVYGPVTLLVHNFDSNGEDVVVQCEKKSDSSRVSLTQDTVVSGENTGYTGNASTLIFSGQTLNNLPIVPGTVTVKPIAGGNTVNATDYLKNGILYTSDVDLDACGTINYFTGALYLSYPAGKDPAAGAISADYTYCSKVEKGGMLSLNLPFISGQDNETVIVKAAASSNSRIVVEAFIPSR